MRAGSQHYHNNGTTNSSDMICQYLYGLARESIVVEATTI